MNSMSLKEAANQNTVNGLITQALLELDSATPDDEGVNYKPLYYYLFNGISDVLNKKESIYGAFDPVFSVIINALKKLQCGAEDLIMKQGETKT